MFGGRFAWIFLRFGIEMDVKLGNMVFGVTGLIIGLWLLISSLFEDSSSIEVDIKAKKDDKKQSGNQEKEKELKKKKISGKQKEE
jgi:hypothetical protein